MLPHMEHLYRLAYRFTGNQDDAEDLLQDLLAKCLARSEQLASIENPRAWLARVLHNLYIDQVRRQANWVAWTEENTTDPMQANSNLPTAPEVGLSFKQIKQALEQINPDQRTLLAMHDIEGYTLTEISEILATPVGTLKSRLNRARKKLKNFLSEEPIEPNKRLYK